ncbi:MAG: general secretion pathway protein GspE [Myxococcaceae bacterium]|nr:general secretion pathway protein GspE [Myxococcaceae bacterium]
MARKRIGEVLLEKGVISQAQLDQSLALQKRLNLKAGPALVQSGHISEEELVATLSEALNISIVHLPAIVPDWSAVHMLRARFCELNDVFPFAIDKSGPKKTLVVALSDPLAAPTLSEIEFTTGLPVSPRLATLTAIRAAIARYYHKAAGPTPSAPGPAAPFAPLLSASPGSKSALPTAAPQSLEEDEPIVMGTVLLDEELPTRPMPAIVPSRAPMLAGKADDATAVTLEKKFWAMLRILERKGLVTKDEFANELKDDEE